MNKSRQRSNPRTVFYHNDKEVPDSLEIVNHFCNFFSNIGPNLAQKILKTNVSPQSYLSGEFSDSIFIDPISETELITITKNFQAAKSPGYDNITMSVIQYTINTIVKPLTYIVNLSFSCGIFPDHLKISCIVPLFKSGDKSIFSNYRQFQYFLHF